MKFVSLASGSKGNATLIATDTTKILIDCGISAKRAEEELKALGTGLDEIDALFLTHEHSDHIKGVKRLMAAYGIRVYGTAGTLDALARVTKDEYFRYAGSELMEAIMPGFTVEIGDISVLPFSTHHDAAGPCAYRFGIGEKSVAVMTDCGGFDDDIVQHLTDLDALLLEANHDLDMLMTGPYPMMLKRRIMSMKGHLSNNASGELLSKVFAPRLRHVLLGHLSMDNNTHLLAMETVLRELTERRGEAAAELLDLNVAPQNGISKIIEL